MRKKKETNFFIFLVRLDDLKKTPQLVMNKIFNFLQVDSHDFKNEFPVYNATSNNSEIDDEEIAKTLSEYYAPHNQRLQRLFPEYSDLIKNWR